MSSVILYNNKLYTGVYSLEEYLRQIYDSLEHVEILKEFVVVDDLDPTQEPIILKYQVLELPEGYDLVAVQKPTPEPKPDSNGTVWKQVEDPTGTSLPDETCENCSIRRGSYCMKMDAQVTPNTAACCNKLVWSYAGKQISPELAEVLNNKETGRGR